jgi:hypothetical protein
LRCKKGKLGLFADSAEDEIDFRAGPVIRFGEAVRYDPLGVGDEDDRVRDAMSRRAHRIVFVQDAERLDDCGFRIGKQRQLDAPPLGEGRERPDVVIADRCDIVAAGGEFIDPFVPGDRLDLAVGSPVERAGEQQYEAGSSGQRFQAAGFALLVGRSHGERYGRTGLETLVELVACLCRKGGI